mmetsp:Transcript_44886/g.71308  ORF Transcript_44886/g.71308 Transcript_44886/m.71308 type:complete len:145 (+) Transcript_44886:1077-1511(+)
MGKEVLIHELWAQRICGQANREGEWPQTFLVQCYRGYASKGLQEVLSAVVKYASQNALEILLEKDGFLTRASKMDTIEKDPFTLPGLNKLSKPLPKEQCSAMSIKTSCVKYFWLVSHSWMSSQRTNSRLLARTCGSKSLATLEI